MSPRYASGSSYPEYSYEQFYRENPSKGRSRKDRILGMTQVLREQVGGVESDPMARRIASAKLTAIDELAEAGSFSRIPRLTQSLRGQLGGVRDPMARGFISHALNAIDELASGKNPAKRNPSKGPFEVSYVEWTTGENRRAPKQRFSSFAAAKKSASQWMKKQGAQRTVADGLATSDDGLRTSVQVAEDTLGSRLKAVAFIEWPSEMASPFDDAGQNPIGLANPSKRGKTRQPALLPVPHSVKPGKKANAEWVYAGKYPIGDLYHAKLAVIAVARSRSGVRDEVWSAVVAQYPYYDWAMYLDEQKQGSRVRKSRNNPKKTGLKLGRAYYDELPTHGGPYLPDMYPYGQGGRPAVYRRNPRVMSSGQWSRVKDPFPLRGLERDEDHDHAAMLGRLHELGLVEDKDKRRAKKKKRGAVRVFRQSRDNPSHKAEIRAWMRKKHGNDWSKNKALKEEYRAMVKVHSSRRARKNGLGIQGF